MSEFPGTTQPSPQFNLPREGVTARGLWSGYGFMAEFLIADPGTYALRGKPINTYGDILVVSSDFPARPTTDAAGNAVPTQSSVIRDFLLERNRIERERALRRGDQPPRSGSEHYTLTKKQVIDSLIQQYVDRSLEAYIEGDLEPQDSR